VIASASISMRQASGHRRRRAPGGSRARASTHGSPLRGRRGSRPSPTVPPTASRPHQTEAFYVGNALKAELVDVFIDGTTIQGLEQEPPDQDGR
jgi:hypothetical protein